MVLQIIRSSSRPDSVNRARGRTQLQATAGREGGEARVAHSYKRGRCVSSAFTFRV